MVRLARRCERTAKQFDEGPLADSNKRLIQACGDVGLASSGSWLGYQSTVYLDGFRKPRPGEFFSIQYGCGGESSGRWMECSYEEVQAEIRRRANLSDTKQLEDAANDSKIVFESAKNCAVPILDAILSNNGDPTLEEVRKK